jgi:hypothetical protein
MSTTTMPSNGKVQRKQLADQLDRLDAILDLMAEGLPAAVADACREGTRLAVKDAVVQILTDPELRAMLVSHLPAPVPAPATPDVPPKPKKPSIWSRLKTKFATAKSVTVAFAAKAKTAVAAKCAALTATVAAIGTAAGEALQVRRVAGIALGVGLVVALACCQMPETMSAAVAGVGAATSAVLAQIGGWLHRAARRVGLLS